MTIYVHRRINKDCQLPDICYIPVSIFSFSSKDLVDSICRVYDIAPTSVYPTLIWYDPETGRHDVVDESFISTLEDDQDFVVDFFGLPSKCNGFYTFMIS